jgi:hypothetical protein
LGVYGPCEAGSGCVEHNIYDATLLVSMLPPRAADDNDEAERQGRRVYLHLGVRRDDPAHR